MSLGAVVKVIIAGDNKGVKKALAETSAETKKAEGSFGKLAGAGKKAFMGLASGAIGVGIIAVKFANEEEDAHVKLAQALKNSGHAHDINSKSVEAAAAAGRKLGFSTQDTYGALARGVTSTGSLTKSVKLLAMAQNVSALTGKPLEASMLAVTKASQGQLKPLKMLGIDLPIAAGGAVKVAAAQAKLAKAHQNVTATMAKLTEAEKAQDLVEAAIHKGLLTGNKALKAREKAAKDVGKADDATAKAHVALDAAQKNFNTTASAGTNIMTALAAKIKGQAAASAETFSGKLKAMKVEGEHMFALIGAKLIPILIKLMSGIQGVVVWLGKHKAVAIALGVVIGTVTVGLAAFYVAQKAIAVGTKLWTVATKAWSIACKAASALQWLFNAALDANPIGVVVIAIAALAAGVIYAYTHFKWFRTAVQAVWGAIQTTFGWVKEHWPLILAILTGPFGIAVLLITKNWSTIKNGFSDVVSWISNGVGSIVSFITSIPGKISSVASSIGSTLLHGILSGLGSAVGAVGSFVTQVAGGIKNLINQYILDPIRNIEIKWGGFHGIGKFDLHPFSFIPKLHTGGIFNSGMGEGPAILKDGEGIFTQGQMAAIGRRLNNGAAPGGGGGTTIINFPAGSAPAAVQAAQARWNRRNGRPS